MRAVSLPTMSIGTVLCGLGSCLCLNSICGDCFGFNHTISGLQCCEQLVQGVGICCGLVVGVPVGTPIGLVLGAVGRGCNFYPKCCHVINLNITLENRRHLFNLSSSNEDSGPPRQEIVENSFYNSTSNSASNFASNSASNSTSKL